MKAGVEWLVGVVRAGPNFHKHGDPYEFIVSILKQDKKAFLCGASGVFDKKTYAAVKKALEHLDLEDVSWEKKNIKPRKISKNPGKQ